MLFSNGSYEKVIEHFCLEIVCTTVQPGPGNEMSSDSEIEMHLNVQMVLYLVDEEQFLIFANRSL